MCLISRHDRHMNCVTDKAAVTRQDIYIAHPTQKGALIYVQMLNQPKYVGRFRAANPEFTIYIYGGVDWSNGSVPDFHANGPSSNRGGGEQFIVSQQYRRDSLAKSIHNKPDCVRLLPDDPTGTTTWVRLWYAGVFYTKDTWCVD